jgi:hypothetical protein
MTFEYWEFDGGHSFMEVGAHYHQLMEQFKARRPSARCTWTVEAESWKDAMKALDEHLGAPDAGELKDGEA